MYTCCTLIRLSPAADFRECLSPEMAGLVSGAPRIALRLRDDHRLRQLDRTGLINAVVRAVTEHAFRYGWK
jgi:hypothetical protein